MHANNRSYFVMALFTLLVVAVACSSSELPVTTNAPEEIPTASSLAVTVNTDLPTSLDDPRCSGSTRTFPSEASSGAAFNVSIGSQTPPTIGATPLTTATPRPGTVQFSAHLDVSGNSVDCFEVGDEASFSFGGTHDFGSDLLLRVTVDVPLNLQADSFDLFTSLNGADWVQDYPMPQPGGSPVSTGNTNFRLTSTIPGMYEVTLTSKWLDLESMNPVDTPNQSEERTLTYYVLPK